jgi:hypothetical protein
MWPPAIQRWSVTSEMPTALAAYRVEKGFFIYAIYISYLESFVKAFFHKRPLTLSG